MDAKISNSDEMKNVLQVKSIPTRIALSILSNRHYYPFSLNKIRPARHNTVIEQFQTQHFRKILPIIFRRPDMYLIGNRCTQSISPVLIEKFTVPLYNSYSL